MSPTPATLEVDKGIGDTIDQLREKLDTAVSRSVDLHRSGATDDAVVAETAVALRAAKALELLTGETVESQLARREEPGPRCPPAPVSRRRWLRRSRVGDAEDPGR